MCILYNYILFKVSGTDMIVYIVYLYVSGTDISLSDLEIQRYGVAIYFV